MNVRLAAVVAVLCWAMAPAAPAHRLDEFLQATTIAVAPDRVVVQLRLTPGIAVASAVIAELDTDGDGNISEREQREYTVRVLHDLSLTVDDRRLVLRAVSTVFPTVGEMQEGLGEILLRLEADVPGGGSDHRLIFENHYGSGTAVYLVNCLLPGEPNGIRVNAQNRNYEQSWFQLDYTLMPVQPNTPPVFSGAGTSGEAAQPGQRSRSATAFHVFPRLSTNGTRWLLVGMLVLTTVILWRRVRASWRAPGSVSPSWRQRH